MPIDPRMVTWDDASGSAGSAPAIDPRMVQWQDVTPQTPFFSVDRFLSDLKATPGDLANLVAGGIKGASNIGATLLAPVDAAVRFTGANNDYFGPNGMLLGRNDRRQATTQGLQAAGDALGVNVDPNSGGYKLGQIGTEVAGTMGVGGALAAPARFVASVAPKAAPVLNTAANLLESGGFNVGSKLPLWASVPARASAGAVVGGASAGLVNPDDAGTGAVIGGVLPGASQVAGKSAQFVANAFRNATTPQDVKAAQALAQKLGVTADDLTAAITGPQLIPGYKPTVPQIVMDPTASQLQRTLQTNGQQQIANAVATQQAQFRNALGNIAPIAPTLNDAAARAGNAIQAYAIPAEAAASRNVSALFDAVPDAQATMQLPLQAMQNAQTRFVGPGSFGQGNSLVEQAMNTATNIGMDPLTRIDPRVVPFSQIQSLRSSIGEAITQAQAKGQNKAAAALTEMKNAIDNKVADVAAGNAMPGEVFTPQAIDQWGQALAAHQQKMQQFRTGPQASMFRMGADGQPVIQGAEIPPKFYNGNMSQIEDMQAFKRLIGNRDDLAQELKSFALTQGLDTAGKSGNLGQTFIDWVRSRSGANRELFSQSEQATINEVGKAVQRQIQAEELGRVSGPDTAQKLASLNSNGLLDNKMVDAFANKIPLIGKFTGPMLGALRNSANQTRGGIQAGLLADPEAFAAALRRAPGTLNLDVAPLGLLTRGAYPALLGQ